MTWGKRKGKAGTGTITGRQTLQVDGLTVEVTRKVMSTMRMRLDVTRGVVVLSAPSAMPDAEIGRFVAKYAPRYRAELEEARRQAGAVAGGDGAGGDGACRAGRGPRVDLRSPHVEADGTMWLWGRKVPLYEAAPLTTALLMRIDGLGSGQALPKSVTLKPAAIPPAYRDLGRLAAILEGAPECAAHVQKAAVADLRDQIEPRARELIGHYQQVMGVKVSTLLFKDMTSQWGNCRKSDARIVLNVSLAHLEPAMLEETVVHEMCHLFEANHGPGFYALMDEYLPGWRRTRAARKALR